MIKAMSWIQEFSVQEWPTRPFDDSLERPQPTPEEENKMDREIVALGNLMKDSGVWWQLDGSLNISLRAGNYIGLHRDVDISILREDVLQLEEHLLCRGYGLFKLAKEPDRRILRRVGARAFKSREEMGRWWQLRFCAVNERGIVRLDVDLPAIEVTVLEKGGKEKLPVEWLRGGETIDFKGVPVNLSHPARFLFHKMWSHRGPSDENDIAKFLEMRLLTLRDVNQISQLANLILEEFNPQDEEDQKTRRIIHERIERFRNST